jgi:hypothetical protein
MPTARELLEQADALMRRNRGGDGGIPVLTDAVSDEADISSRGPATRERAGPSTRDQVAEARAPRERPERESAGDEGGGAGREDDVALPEPPTAERAENVEAQDNAAGVASDSDLPILTEAVDESELSVAPEPRKTTEEESAPWLGPDTIDPALHSITGPAPDTVGVVPPVAIRVAGAHTEAARPENEADAVIRTLRAAGSEPTPPPTGSAPPEPSPVPPPTGPEPSPVATTTPEPAQAESGNEDERWRALAEQISMQVLQRLDLFIDSGLKSQLASHLQPIVARASAELVEAINDHVGQLVRTYVAEAIEREIAQWRKQQQ